MSDSRVQLNTRQSQTLKSIAESNKLTTAQTIDRLLKMADGKTLDQLERLLTEKEKSVKTPKRFQSDDVTQSLALYLADRQNQRQGSIKFGMAFQPLKLRAIGSKLKEDKYGGTERGVATMVKYIENTKFLKHLDPSSDDIENELIEAFQKASLIEVE